MKASLGLIYVYYYADKRTFNWTTGDYQQKLPYRGQGDYSRGAVEYVLISNITIWDDTKLGYQASGLLRVDFRTRPIDIVCNAWGV